MNKLTSLFVSSRELNRNNNINLVRFVAAAMVIYGHMAHLTGNPVPLFFGQEVSSVAVKIFFVLSGYLITQSFLRDENAFRYYVRRIFRIIPGLVFVVVVTVVIIGPIFSSQSISQYFGSPDTYRYLQNIFLKPVYSLPGVFVENTYPNAVNGSLWTLPVEFLMYILLPFAVLFFRKIRILKAGLAILGGVFLVLSILKVNFFADARFVIWGTNIFDCLTLAPYFFAGAFFSFPELKRVFNTQISFAALFIMAILVFANYSQYEVILFFVLPYITLSFCFASPAVFGRVFAVNDYSYGLYLWGFVVQQSIVYILGADAFGLLPYTAICFVVALLCAMISWHAVEKPLSSLGKRITNWSRHIQQKKG